MVKKTKKENILDEEDLEDEGDSVELFKLRKFLNRFYPDAIDEYEMRENDRIENVHIKE